MRIQCQGGKLKKNKEIMAKPERLDKTNSVTSASQKELNPLEWLAYGMIALGTVISLPWIIELVPNLEEIFYAWMFATDGADTNSSMTFEQWGVFIILLAMFVTPLGGLVYLGFTVCYSLFDKDRFRLRTMAHVLWVKSVVPLISSILIALLNGSSEWSLSKVDLQLLFLNPLSGFWFYSPLLGLAALIAVQPTTGKNRFAKKP